MTSLTIIRRIAPALAVLASVAAATPAPAQQPTEVVPSLEGLSAELLTVQKSLQNARLKLSRGVVVVPDGTDTTERPDTPAYRCCTTNLVTIHSALQRIVLHIDGLARQADAAEDEIALGQLELIHDGTNGLAVGLRAFAEAAEGRRAQAALDGMIRPFNGATSAMRGLSTCCAEVFGPSADESDPGEPKKASKKKKR